LNQKYYPFLDGFRAIAVFAVAMTHGMPLFKMGNTIEIFFRKLFSIGHLGVDMFFVISGFLITGILIEDWEGSIRLKRFYLRRYFKIYPQYLFALIFVIGVLIVINEISLTHVLTNGTEFFRLFSYFILIQNYTHQYGLFAHTWSLAIEEHFYLMYPLILTVIFKLCRGQDKRRKNLIFLSILSIAAVIVSRHWGNGTDVISILLNAPEPSHTTFFRIDALFWQVIVSVYSAPM